MTSVAPVVALASADRLGESPVWDDRTGSLWRVDAGAVDRLDVTTGQEPRYDVGRHGDVPGVPVPRWRYDA